MSVPQNRPPLMIKTASGQSTQVKPGQRVGVDDVPRIVDIVIVFDTTGSMSDKIDGLVRCLQSFVAELDRSKLDWRFSVVPFGDLTIPGDRVVGNLPFVTTCQAAGQMVETLPQFSGGGNVGESSLEAMQAAMAKSYREGAIKVLVMLTDDDPLISPQLTPVSIGKALRQREFVCFVASHPGRGYEAWANENAGKWYPIGSSMDTSDLLDFLNGLLKDVAKVSKAIFAIGGGSVSRYILTEGERHKPLGR